MRLCITPGPGLQNALVRMALDELLNLRRASYACFITYLINGRKENRQGDEGLELKDDKDFIIVLR